MPISTHQVRPFSDAASALAFITAGNAHFTLVSTKSGKRYTYRVARPFDAAKNKRAETGPLLASVLYGPDNGTDYRYAGVVRDGRLVPTAKSKLTCDDPRFAGLDWAIGTMSTKGEIPSTLEV